MEKKNEMGFLEKFEAAGKEMEKVMSVSNKDAMIMIATSVGNDGRLISTRIKGDSVALASLLACVATDDKDFKTILTDAIRGVEAWEQINKYYGKERNQLY